MNVMLLAAGMGTRLRPYTEVMPKPAIPFLTVPLACYSLALLEKINIKNLVVNTHYRPEQVEQLFYQINWPCNKLIFSEERTQILGSGGGIRQAIDSLVGKGSFIVANADEVILPDYSDIISDALAFHKAHAGLATIMTIPHAEVGKKFGGLWLKVTTEKSTKVTCFSKTPVPDHDGRHYVGMMILSDRIKDYFFLDSTKEENIFYDTLTSAMSLGEEVHSFEVQAQWFETGNPEDFISATRTCIAEIQKPQPGPWAQYLQQVLRRHSTGQFLIEKDHAGLEVAIRKVLNY